MADHDINNIQIFALITRPMSIIPLIVNLQNPFADKLMQLIMGFEFVGQTLLQQQSTGELIVKIFRQVITILHKNVGYLDNRHFRIA